MNGSSPALPPHPALRAMLLCASQMPDTSGEDFHPPWTVSGEEAESRAKGVSPAELVKREGKAAD
eukprot:814233-Pleurochrysis_carterae.AAC.1